MESLSVRQARQPEAIGKQAVVQGWIRTRRDSKGGFSFLDVNDGSSLAGLQIIADGSLAIIDYKTGDRAKGADWFGPRLRDAQVPLYATTGAERVGAAVVVRLGADETR